MAAAPSAARDSNREITEMNKYNEILNKANTERESL